MENNQVDNSDIITTSASQQIANIRQNMAEAGADTREVNQVDEFMALKNRARQMNLKFSNNISMETLRAKVEAALQGEPDPAPEQNEEVNPFEQSSAPAPTAPTAPAARMALNGKPLNNEVALRRKMYEEQMKLVRIRISNLDPKKKDIPGEVFTIANEYLGTVKKYVPFGEVTADGYHVPYCIYRHLDGRKFLNIRTRRDPITKREFQETTWAKEFSIEVLPPLTENERQTLAAAQAAAGIV